MHNNEAAAKPSIGVCYFPEQRDEDLWKSDIDRMKEIGLKKVRLAEFSWAVVEPEPRKYNWDWLDKSIELCGAAGLEVILCTPTATPPKWIIDANPEILAVDKFGNPRRFGSRRHYCFSSPIYREKMAAIVEAFAKRYGENPHVTAWQTDNEYGCHNTTRSYSEAAEAAFRAWLASRYGSIDALNDAWGNTFWSMLYNSFDQVDLPNLTVTEPNPSHVLDFYRFSSDQVVSFNKLQVDILRAHSPGRDIIHNFMGFYHAFDHFKVGRDLDIAAWDSYPTGFLDMFNFTAEEKARYFRQGHPDIAAFHHDLYRACANGRWAVIEQQPGPVNWANNNCVPLPGMVKLWSLEAIAHGAEFVTYFRWDQARYAQEQMHAGLLLPNNTPAPAYAEAKEAAADVAALSHVETADKEVALVFSYDAVWLFEAHPQGIEWSYTDLCFRWYSELRKLGLNIDFVEPGAPLDGYKLVVIPSSPIIDDISLKVLKETKAPVLFGPRSGSKTGSLQIPSRLAPGPLQELVPVRVTQSESLSSQILETITYEGETFFAGTWLDYIETDLTPLAKTERGQGALYRNDNYVYLSTIPDQRWLEQIFRDLIEESDLNVLDVSDDIRVKRNKDRAFAFNYGPVTNSVSSAALGRSKEGGTEIELSPAGTIFRS